ncbi:hypothetical protein [Nevskia sp.]|uniref:hypothetical protein n=1 Tax=Nevskia sp. TaxID=1929292 RepID=UPI0025D2C42D|nr:hypothetical protein [Nevskia sp.]
MRAILSLLIALPLLLLGGCQRRSSLDLSLTVHGTLAESHVLARPVAVELLDPEGRLHRLRLREPDQIDLSAAQALNAPLHLPLRGRLRPGHYVGLRLVFADSAWLEAANGSRQPLKVDVRGPFAPLDVQLSAHDRQRLTAQIDLPASVPQQGVFHERLSFLPALSVSSVGSR